MVVAKQGELLSMILFDLHIHTTLSASRLRRNILQCSSLHTPHLDCGRVRVGAQRRLRHDQGGAVVETDTFSFRNHDQQPLGRGRLSPTVPPMEEELDYGAPLLLGSRGDDVTPRCLTSSRLAGLCSSLSAAGARATKTLRQRSPSPGR